VDSFLVRHLVWTHLDERHELGVLLIADPAVIGTACAGLTPLLSKALGGMSKDAAGVPEALAGLLREGNRPIGVIVVWDGQVYTGAAGGCRLYHYHRGQLTVISAEKASQRTLALGDWLAVLSPRPPGSPEARTLQEEMDRMSSAAQLTWQWAEHHGTVIVAVRAI
jgi:hypothetical protein